MLVKRVFSSLVYKQLYFITSLVILVSLFKLLDPEQYFYYGSLSIVFLFLRNVIDTIAIQLYLNYKVDSFKNKLIFFLVVLNTLILFVLDLSIEHKLLGSITLIFSYYLAGKCVPYICFLNVNADYRGYNIVTSVSEALSFCLFVAFKEQLMFAILLKNISYFVFQLLLYKVFVKIDNLKFQAIANKVVVEFGLFFIFNFFSKNLDKIIVSLLFGNIAFSLYERSMALVRAVISVFSFSIAPALLLSLKEIEDGKLTWLYIKYQQVLFMFALLVLIIYKLTIPYFILYIGNDWSEIVMYLDGLLLAFPIMLMIGNTSQFYLNQSETRLNLISAILSFMAVMLYMLLASYLFNDFEDVIKYLFIPFFINLVQVNYLYFIKIRRESYFLFILSITIQTIYFILCLI
ncbi:hypothetical protein [Pseudoalteromonas atlantica]|uniref:hypothetical protein n=1 Tax=Pseudoalteromonas atlantica TaxID=288 RepID=UPI003735AC4D